MRTSGMRLRPCGMCFGPYAACPGATEAMRSRLPSFEYHGLLCAMGASDDYCTFGVWQAAMRGTATALRATPWERSDASRGSPICPEDGTLKALVRRAAKLNAMGVKPRTAGGKRGPLVVPKDLATALRANGSARASFKRLSRDPQRAYVEWIESAKRLTDAIEAMSRQSRVEKRYGRMSRPASAPRR